MATYVRDDDGTIVSSKLSVYIYIHLIIHTINQTRSLDAPGKFIPASQRPDGTWRKARRVKDGYIPQEEVPLYESKGKQFTKKPDLPVGMCPQMAKAAQEQRLKQQLKQQRAAAAAAATATTASAPAANKKPAKQTSTPQPAASHHPASNPTPATLLTASMATISLKSEEDVQKQLKKLRKKIREIEAIEEKLQSGSLKAPEQDQLDKVSRKTEILQQIAGLEKL